MARGMIAICFDSEYQKQVAKILFDNRKVKILDHCDIISGLDQLIGQLYFIEGPAILVYLACALSEKGIKNKKRVNVKTLGDEIQL